jgi:hypothetical protein
VEFGVNMPYFNLSPKLVHLKHRWLSRGPAQSVIWGQWDLGATYHILWQTANSWNGLRVVANGCREFRVARCCGITPPSLLILVFKRWKCQVTFNWPTMPPHCRQKVEAYQFIILLSAVVWTSQISVLKAGPLVYWVIIGWINMQIPECFVPRAVLR